MSDTATNTEGGVHATNAPGAGQVVFVETLGRLGLFVILVLFLVVVALAFFTGRTDGLGEARAEAVDAQVRQMNSRVSVLEYDSKGLCGQLLAKKIVEACH